MALNWIDAGIRYLPASAAESLKSRFAALRGAILADMSAEQISAASRLVSPDGPVAPAKIHDQDALLKQAIKDYPRFLRKPGRRSTVVLVLQVHPDGSVGDMMIETSSGHREIDAATEHVLASAKIEPQRVDGEPVESWQLVELTYSAGASAAPQDQSFTLPRLPGLPPMRR